MSAIKSFGFPIPPDCVRLFRHEHRRHVFGEAYRHDGQVLACDGCVALRVDRGHWMLEDWDAAPPAFLERFLSIAWEPVPSPKGDHWRALDDARGAIVAARRGDVRVGQSFIATLIQIRLVARLPRCEVWTAGSEGDHLHFRFSGGSGLIGFQSTRYYPEPSVGLTILRPLRHHDGDLLKRAPGVNLGLPGWPPPPPTD